MRLKHDNHENVPPLPSAPFIMLCWICLAELLLICTVSKPRHGSTACRRAADCYNLGDQPRHGLTEIKSESLFSHVIEVCGLTRISS